MLMEMWAKSNGKNDNLSYLLMVKGEEPILEPTRKQMRRSGASNVYHILIKLTATCYC